MMLTYDVDLNGQSRFMLCRLGDRGLVMLALWAYGYEMSVEVILTGHALGLLVLFPLRVAGFQ